MTIWAHIFSAGRSPAKLAVPTDNEHQGYLVPSDTLDSAGDKGSTINLQINSAAGDYQRQFFAIADSNDSTCLESGIVEVFGIKIPGRHKARVSEQFLIDTMLIWPDSPGVAKRAALSNPSRLSEATTLGTDLGISKIAVYLSRQLIKFSYTVFSYGA